MFIKHIFLLLLTSFLVFLTACGKQGFSNNNESSLPKYTVSGKITYDWVPAKDNVTEGGVRLDYSAAAARPARRVIVQAVRGGAIYGQTTTDDNGNYTMSVSGGPYTIRALARSTVTSSTADGVSPDNCVGSSWDVRVVDNVTGSSSSSTDPTLRANHSVQSSTSYDGDQSGVNLNAAITVTGSGSSTSYTSRVAAPFALLDTIITEMEMVCKGAVAAGTSTITYPTLYVNWSTSNTNSSGNKYQGQITTSHFILESGVGNLYILGKEGVDTDEYDDHVIAHEYGHYLESRLFRSDSVGGAHSLGDELDPRVAFGEGFGNAISAMTFADTIYVDTNGSGQQTGFAININQAPSSNDRGIYSERSAQYVLWNLFENRDGTSNSGTFDRIFNILRNYQRTTSAFTTLHSFSAFYNQVYGDSESLFTLWTTNIDTPKDSLCSGSCSGTAGAGTIDLFDADNNIGTYYAGVPKKLGGSSGTSMSSSDFWKLYKPLTSGTNTADGHDVTNFSGYTGTSRNNKIGAVRWYRFTGTGTAMSVSVSTSSGGCATDLLDMYVYNSGTMVGYDESAGGCPSVSLSSTTSGQIYVVAVHGYTTAVTGITMVVSP